MQKSCHAMQKPCKKLFSPAIRAGIPENARPGKKNWPRKKRMASWARQRQQITEAADGGARARTGADGAVVLHLRRGPEAYALLSRADGQLTRAGQRYYSHLGLRPPNKARTQYVVHAEGLGGRGGRRGGVVRRVGKLLAQVQVFRMSLLPS